jgi:hypothetical protein
MSLLSRFTEPHGCFLLALRHALSVEKHHAQFKLTACVASLRQFAVLIE